MLSGAPGGGVAGLSGPDDEFGGGWPSNEEIVMGIEHDSQDESMTSTLAWTGAAIAVCAALAFFVAQ